MTHDAYIAAANQALQEEGGYQARRRNDGTIELFAEDDSLFGIFSDGVPVDDLVSIALALSHTWECACEYAEKTKLREVQRWIVDLKQEHGATLSARHIENAIADDLYFYIEREEEEAAHAAAEQNQT